MRVDGLHKAGQKRRERPEHSQELVKQDLYRKYLCIAKGKSIMHIVDVICELSLMLVEQDGPELQLEASADISEETHNIAVRRRG